MSSYLLKEVVGHGINSYHKSRASLPRDPTLVNQALSGKLDVCI